MVFDPSRSVKEKQHQEDLQRLRGLRLIDDRVCEWLSTSLTEQFGRGYSVDNLENMRKFYIAYRDRISETLFRKFAIEKSETFSRILEESPFQLSFSHYLILSRRLRCERNAGQHITVEMVVCCPLFLWGVTIWNIHLKSRKSSVE